MESYVYVWQIEIVYFIAVEGMKINVSQISVSVNVGCQYVLVSCSSCSISGRLISAFQKLPI